VVIKVFFLVLVLCTAAVVAVILAIHFRVKKHLRQDAVPPTSPESALVGVEEHNDEKTGSVIDGAADDAAGESHPMKSS
jgi:hypothetical protein